MNQTETNDSSVIGYIQKVHRWRMAFFCLVILLAGIAIGAASAIILSRHRMIVPSNGPEFVSERMVRSLQRRLQLSPDQAEKVESILQQRMQKLHEIRMNARPQITEQLRLMNEEISALLTERQKRIWQERLYRLQQQIRLPGLRPGIGQELLPFRRGQRGPSSPPSNKQIDQ